MRISAFPARHAELADMARSAYRLATRSKSMTATPPEADVLLDANGPLLANRIRILIAPWGSRIWATTDVAPNGFRQGSERGQRHKADLL